LRAARIAPVIEICGLPLRAIDGNRIEQIHHLAVSTVALDQERERILTSATAFVARNFQDIELADEIAEYGCAVGSIYSESVCNSPRNWCSLSGFDGSRIQPAVPHLIMRGLFGIGRTQDRRR
jgi:hypothetical protein